MEVLTQHSELSQERPQETPSPWKWARPLPWRAFEGSEQWQNAPPKNRLKGIITHAERTTGWLIQEGMEPEDAHARSHAFIKKRLDENPDVYRQFTWQEVENRGLVDVARTAINTLEDFATFGNAYTWAEREELIRLADRVSTEDLPILAEAMWAWTEDQSVDEHGISQFFRNVARGVDGAVSGAYQGVRKLHISDVESAMEDGRLVTQLSPDAFQDLYISGNTNRLLGSVRPGSSTNEWYVGPAASAREIKRSLTPQEREQIQSAIATERKRMQFSALLGQVHRGRADQLEALEQTFVGRAAGVTSGSIGYLLAGSLPGGQAILAASFANDAYDRIAEVSPDLSEDQKWGYALSVGIVQAQIEKLQRIPMLKGLNSGTLMTKLGVNVASRSGAVTNFTVKTGTGVLAEGGMEFLQESTPAFAQSLLSELNETVPDVDWKEELAPFLDVTPEMMLGMLPLVALGSSRGSIQDATDYRDSLLDPRRLMAMGLNPEASQRIAALVDEDLSAAAREYQQQYRHHRDPGSATAVQAREALEARVRQEAQDREQRFAQLEAAGIIERAEVMPATSRSETDQNSGQGSDVVLEFTDEDWANAPVAEITGTPLNTPPRTLADEVVTLTDSQLEQLPEGSARDAIAQLPTSFEEALELARSTEVDSKESVTANSTVEPRDTPSLAITRTLTPDGSYRTDVRVIADSDASLKASPATEVQRGTHGEVQTITVTRSLEPGDLSDLPAEVHAPLERVIAAHSTNPLANGQIAESRSHSEPSPSDRESALRLTDQLADRFRDLIPGGVDVMDQDGAARVLDQRLPGWRRRARDGQTPAGVWYVGSDGKPRVLLQIHKTGADIEPLSFQAGGSSKGYKHFPKTPGLASETSIDELLTSGALPGSHGVKLTDHDIRFGDLFVLSTLNGRRIEFALVREYNKYWLYSGDAKQVRTPGLPEVRLLAHTDPNGGKFVGGADEMALFRHFLRRKFSGMTNQEARYPSRVIYGPGDTDNLIFWPKHPKSK